MYVYMYFMQSIVHIKDTVLLFTPAFALSLPVAVMPSAFAVLTMLVVECSVMVKL